MEIEQKKADEMTQYRNTMIIPSFDNAIAKKSKECYADAMIVNIDFFNISKYQEVVYQNRYPNIFGEIKISRHLYLLRFCYTTTLQFLAGL